MTKIKIAAIIACMLATGAFAGFTYQAANNSESEEKVTVKTIDTAEEEMVADEVTTDDEVTDEETTADEVTAEETAPIVIVLREKEDEPETEEEEAAEATTAKKAADDIEMMEQALEAAPVVTEAPVAEYIPETMPEYEQYDEVYEDYVEYIEPETYYYYEYEEVQPEVVEDHYEETTEQVTEAPAEEEPETVEETEAEPEEAPVEEPAQEESARKVEVTDAEYIWLCNVVGHEYGADWISIEEKAKVVEVIMNRVNDPRFPNSIWSVLTQPYQFSGLEWTLYLGTYSYQVTDSVKEAVDYYLEHPENFQHGYLGFWGDGRRNHFYSV